MRSFRAVAAAASARFRGGRNCIHWNHLRSGQRSHLLTVIAEKRRRARETSMYARRKSISDPVDLSTPGSFVHYGSDYDASLVLDINKDRSIQGTGKLFRVPYSDMVVDTVEDTMDFILKRECIC